MTDEQKEQMKRELWFGFFTQYLYEHGAITEEKKIELEKKIYK